jgi:hypothetical protein
MTDCLDMEVKLVDAEVAGDTIFHAGLEYGMKEV